MKPKIVVVGSANTDMVVQVQHIPESGETVLGGDYIQAQGGKGANQAVAAARLGAEVTLITRLGRDAFGDASIAAYQADGIDEYIMKTSDSASAHFTWSQEIYRLQDGQQSGLIIADVAGDNVVCFDLQGANHLHRVFVIAIVEIEGLVNRGNPEGS